MASAGTLKEGTTPKKARPIKVATTVASVTNAILRALTETSMSSIANVMPPKGALNVAAIPAPAPAAIRRLR